MTEAQFNAAYSKSRSQFANLTRRTIRKIHDIYEEAARKVADIVKDATERELSELTSATWRQIEAQLKAAASDIREELKAQLQISIEDGADIIGGISEKYLSDLAKFTHGKITKSGIVSMFAGVSRTMVESMVNRIYTDGYTFSQRIWGVGEVFQESIKNVISVGIAANRDVIDIAKDIQVYVDEGKEKLAKRYGDLVDSNFRKRIRGDVDYNALRLARSEMYMCLQDTSVTAGKMNPGCTGLYDWIRNTNEDWNCECPDLEANGPYEEDDIPEYPHPNCLCQVRPQLMDTDEFVDDLVKWSNGEDIDYLDEWYGKYYQERDAA